MTSSDRTPTDESRRLDALRQYEILDTPGDPALDAIAGLAARLCATPIAIITMVDERRQWSKAIVGKGPRELGRDVSFCVHAMHPPRLLVVPDASIDPRFADNPLVLREAGIRFYAGAPLLTPDGHALGTVAVIDSVPRTLEAWQTDALRTLASSVMAHLELRRHQFETTRTDHTLRGMLADQAVTAEALRSSESRYRMLFAQNPMPMWVYDRETWEFLAVNAAAVAHYGYTESEFLGMRLGDIRDAAVRADFEQAMREVQGGGRHMVRTQHRTKDGRTIDVDVAGDDLRFDDRPARLVMATDVTERVAAEQRKQESDERYALALRGSTAGLWDWNLRTDHAFLSPRYHELLGYVDGELTPHVSTFRSVLHPDDAPAVEDAIGAHLADASRPFDVEYRLRTKAGAYRWFNARGEALRDADGRPHRMSGSIVDITDRRLAAEALRESEERFRLLSRATNDAIWDWDLTTDLVWWNDGYFTLFGYTRDDTPADSSSWKLPIAEDDRARVTASIAEAIASGAESWSDEYRFRRADGTFAHVLDRGYVIRDPDGHAVRMIGGMTDLTERKQAEERMFRAQRMESIGTLAGGIAHDLNNLLSPMLMSVELLRGAVQDEEGRELLRTLQVSASRGAELVQQVLSFARGVEGQRVPLSAGLLVRELQRITRDSFPKSIRTVVSHTDDVWSVLGDPTQLHQVLLNLAVNARDAMPDGGTLTINVTNVVVDRAFAETTPEAKTGEFVSIRVADTGAGIDPVTRGRIFEPFFSTKEVGKGTGLGLSTTMAIVRSHGGFITVYSEPGQGSTFVVYLPASGSETTIGLVSGETPVLPRGKGELVLVVDDEAAIRRIAQRTLERFGYCVLTADNGEEALTVYRDRGHEIDVVLTDMAMPIMDGPALIAALREIDANVRVIGSSGLSAVDGTGRVLGAPITHFVPKPYTAETLLRTLRTALQPVDPGA